jgi:adenylate cyclase
LAPAVVDRLVDDEAALRLGGEEREVTVMFADLSGFTALSTKVSAGELVALTNEYLSIIADEVDRTGGYVDKFIGDAVMAIWGAPAPEPDHALQAVVAAQAAEAEIRRRREAAAAAGRRGFGVKIGLYSGPAVVGNVGSERRYNYTAVGETVNVASRLEGLPGLYGCAIVLGGATAKGLAGRLPLRELDWVAVKGRSEPVAIYEPGGSEPRYAEALAHYRARRFAEAEAIWSELAEADPPSAIMATRARIFRIDPPPDEWSGVWTLATK